MNVGLPGTGIGGLFYIAGALLAPLDAAVGYATGRRREVRWALVSRQLLIALGILGALWITGWGIGYLITLSGGVGGGARGVERGEVVSVIRWAAVLGTGGVLLCILLVVQLLRFTVRRPPRGGTAAEGTEVAAASSRLSSIALPLLMTLASAAAASGQPSPTSADRLLAAGDSAGARAVYQAILGEDPTNSRALYRLAALQGAGSGEQIALLVRYTRAEPDDAWGYSALAEAYAAAGEVDLAMEAYAAALRLEPGEEEFVQGRAGLLALRGSGRTRRPPPEATAQLSGSRDSDEATVVLSRIQLSAGVADGLRVGFGLARTEAEDPFQLASGYEATVLGSWSPSAALRLDWEMGAARLASGAETPGDDHTPVARARARYTRAGGGGGEVRLRQEKLTATPHLFASGASLTEGRARVDLPVFAPLFARLNARSGRLSAPGGDNVRTAVGGGGFIRLSDLAEVNATYHRTTFDAPTDAGYFAPERIDATEIGTYWEYYGAWPLMLVMDGGVGLERISDWNVPAGPWSPAFRFTGLLGWEVTPALELRLELDAYDTRAGSAVIPAASSWRWGSAGTSIRVRLR